MNEWYAAHVSEAQRSEQDEFTAWNGYEVESRPLAHWPTEDLEALSKRLFYGTPAQRAYQAFVVLPELERRWGRE